MYYYSNYVKCNARNCGNIICDSYDCGNSANYDLNYYYACQPNCPGDLRDQPIPGAMYTAYVMTIITACFFGVGVLVNLIYGVVACFCSQGLTGLEKIGLLLGFVWPKLKYYAFRKREFWEDFDFSFKPMIGVEYAINICYAVTLALYIYLEIAGFWQTGPEIANFYMLIWAYVSRITMVGEMTGPFCRADRELFDIRNNSGGAYL